TALIRAEPIVPSHEETQGSLTFRGELPCVAERRKRQTGRRLLFWMERVVRRREYDFYAVLLFCCLEQLIDHRWEMFDVGGGVAKLTCLEWAAYPIVGLMGLLRAKAEKFVLEIRERDRRLWSQKCPGDLCVEEARRRCDLKVFLN